MNRRRVPRFKKDFEQKVKHWNLTPEEGNLGTKHLYALLQKYLSKNVLDELMDITEKCNVLYYVNSEENIWTLTKSQVDEDAVWE